MNNKVLYKLIATILAAYVSISIQAQYTNILISDQGKPNEPSIIFDPINPQYMIAACNINNFFLSADSGRTWVAKKQESPFGVWGDPALTVDSKGRFYYFHLSSPPDGSWIDRIVCQSSDDNGNTWTQGSYAGLNGSKAQDKEWPVVDRKTNTIYLTWTQFDKYGSEAATDSSSIMFARSTDQGKTWSEAKRINEVNGDCVDDDKTVEGAVPAIGPDGEIYVSWAGPSGLTFDRSLDGGETWLDKDIIINDIGGGWSYDIPGILRSNGLPVTKCDTSGGAHNGTIYINWTDQSNGPDDTDVWLVKSTDQGLTWTDPIRVNDDPPGKHQFFTWMDIDQTNGKLYFVFYDRRNFDDGNTEVYMATSTDGGTTFKNFCISDSSFLSASKSVFFGDYTNIAAHNGIVRPVWTRLDSTSLSIWTALINEQPEPSATTESDDKKSELSWKPQDIHFKLCKNQSLSGIIVDENEDIVISLFENKDFSKGKNNIEINPSIHHLEPGIYFLNLDKNNKKVRRKKFIIE